MNTASGRRSALVTIGLGVAAGAVARKPGAASYREGIASMRARASMAKSTKARSGAISTCMDSRNESSSSTTEMCDFFDIVISVAPRTATVQRRY
jgi:hypothetical protein